MYFQAVRARRVPSIPFALCAHVHEQRTARIYRPPRCSRRRLLESPTADCIRGSVYSRGNGHTSPSTARPSLVQQLRQGFGVFRWRHGVRSVTLVEGEVAVLSGVAVEPDHRAAHSRIGRIPHVRKPISPNRVTRAFRHAIIAFWWVHAVIVAKFAGIISILLRFLGNGEQKYSVLIVGRQILVDRGQVMDPCLAAGSEKIAVVSTEHAQFLVVARNRRADYLIFMPVFRVVYTIVRAVVRAEGDGPVHGREQSKTHTTRQHRRL